MLPIDLVIDEAYRLGLGVAGVRAWNRPLAVRKKWLLIEGHRCQVVPLQFFQINQAPSKPTAVHLYLPRSRWPKFVIYVARENELNPKRAFFIVPRGKISKDTAVCSPENWLWKYENAWSLLCQDLKAKQLVPRFQIFSWKLRTVAVEASSLGHQVTFIRQKNEYRRPPFLQSRLLINGRRCQIGSASRLSTDPNNRSSNYVNLNAPTTSWAESLIFPVKPFRGDKGVTFVIPRVLHRHKTTASLSADWILEYADRWETITTEVQEAVQGREQE